MTTEPLKPADELPERIAAYRRLVRALDEALIYTELPRGPAYLLHPMHAKDMPGLAAYLLRAIEG